MDRIDGLQVLRMVAVLLVAWTHAGQPFVVSGLALPNFGIFGVDIFFVISGFILSLIVLRSSSEPGPGSSLSFLRKRAIRIFPVYWVFALYPMLHHFHVRDALLYLPAFFLLPGYRYPELPILVNFSWTLIFEMFFYLLFGAVLLFTSRRRAAFSMIALLVLLVALGRIIDIRHPILIVVMNPILLEFAMGAVAALVYSTRRPQPWIGWSLVALGVALAMVVRTLPLMRANAQWEVLTDHLVMTRTWTWGLAAGLIVSGTVFASPAMRSLPGKLAVLLGNASYSTYLLSGFLLLRYAAPLFRLAAGVHGWAGLALGQTLLTVLVMALGLAFYIVIEKPLLELANRLIPARPARKNHRAASTTSGTAPTR